MVLVVLLVLFADRDETSNATDGFGRRRIEVIDVVVVEDTEVGR